MQKRFGSPPEGPTGRSSALLLKKLGIGLDEGRNWHIMMKEFINLVQHKKLPGKQIAFSMVPSMMHPICSLQFFHLFTVLKTTQKDILNQKALRSFSFSPLSFYHSANIHPNTKHKLILVATTSVPKLP